MDSSSFSAATRCVGMESVQSISPACSADSAVEGSEMNRNVTPEIFGAPAQYVGFAFKVMESPLFRLTNAKGPVPIGCVGSWPLSTLRRCTMAQPLNPPRLVSRLGVGGFRVMATVDRSGAVTLVTALNLSELVSFWSMMRRYE